MRLRTLLFIVFIESLATILMERGFHFFAKDRLGFSDERLLWLALGFGACYVVGALASHTLANRYGERRILRITVLGQTLCHVVLTLWFENPWVLSVCFFAIGLFNGCKWPIIESFVSAGRSATATAKAIGQFNFSWSIAVPGALLIAGPLIDWWSPAMFVVAAAINVVSLIMLAALEARPKHFEDDHPDRAPADQRALYASLVAASRWTMFGSYALVFLLAPLMPRIFGAKGLGWDVKWSTGLSGVMDVMRVVAFVAFQVTAFWHGRRDVLVACIISLPIGFFMVLFGNHTATVLAGEVLFGFFAGAVYYAALYYAMVAKDASVDAGAAHESMIGLGFAVGPLAGLAGVYLAEPLAGMTRTPNTGPHGGETLGMIIGVAPVILLCSIIPLWLIRPKRTTR